MLTPFQVRARRALAGNRFFRALPDECMRWVSRYSVRRGETLFGKGEASDHLYALVGGGLKLFSPGSDGRRISFGLVAPGELVGQIGIADRAPRHASAVALAHSELAQVERGDLELLLERLPALRRALAEASAEAARRLSERLEDGAFLSIEARVEKVLVDCARRFGERIEGGTRIQLRQQDLADVLGLSRESVSKVLGSRAMRGRLRLGRGRIVLLGS
jgi:CRP/FNR family transcriptional regulator, cyclic AMP receptor protein